MALKYVQSPTLYLAGNGVIVGATSAVLTNLTDIYGNVLTMSDFGSLGYITFEPDTTNEESATFTGITANANLTYTLTGLKTSLAKSPYTETSGLVRNHAGGTKLVVTDTAGHWNNFANKVNDETITGRWGSATVPSAGNDYVNKTYADGLAIAGAPDSSTTTKGIGKVSVAPVSATSPIFVGDNDTRVPTQSENDALVGTSGTPSSSNKYVTNDDVSSTGVTDKVIRATGTSLPILNGSNLTNVNISTSLIAGETITAGQPVSLKPYQSDGGITFDTSGNKDFSIGVGGGTSTLSLTIGANNNRILLLNIEYDNSGSGTPNSITWGAQSMTQLDTKDGVGTTQKFKTYYLFAPTTGTNTITVTLPGNGQPWVGTFTVYSYYNVNQGGIDSHAIGYNGSGYASATPTQVNDGVIYLNTYVNKSANTTIPSGLNIGNNQQSNNTTNNHDIISGDSGMVQPKGALQVQGNANTFFAASIGMYPITAPVYGYVNKASSSTVLNFAQQNLYSTYVGIATTGGTLGQTITVQTTGLITGLSSLTPNVNYYLADTAGTISTTGGTNGKLVGQALSTTTLMLLPGEKTISTPLSTGYYANITYTALSDGFVIGTGITSNGATYSGTSTQTIPIRQGQTWVSTGSTTYFTSLI